jgi:hypothetical protein
MKINKEYLIKSIDSVFDSVYSDINHISDNNLDGYLKYYTDDNSRLEVRNHYEKNYLLYRKSDRDLIQRVIPVSNYMFDKVIQKWFSKKYGIKIDGVLLPRR